jgi:hypothetical protein
VTNLTPLESLCARRLAKLQASELVAAAELVAAVREEVRLRPGASCGARALLIVAEGVRLWARLRR